MSSHKLRVLILGGGPSSEHEISLKTAEMVNQCLDKKKYKPVLVKISKTGRWLTPLAKLQNKSDLAFIAMHGEYGEDGQVQKLLEDCGLPYTGSGVTASALGIDKIKSREIFRAHGLRVPDYFLFKKGARIKFPFPVVVKPSDRGSSVGVSIVKTKEDLRLAIKKVLSVSKNILIEKFISGTELTCGVLDDGKFNLTPLLPTEIVPKTGEFFDYTSKYAESGADEITPARVPSKILRELQDIAVKAHVVIGCSGFSRTDMIWNKKQNKIYVLEINTIPGLTAQSLLPKAAAVMGISFPKLLDKIIKSAISKTF